jgi:hypothetical protein
MFSLVLHHGEKEKSEAKTNGKEANEAKKF